MAFDTKAVGVVHTVHIEKTGVKNIDYKPGLLWVQLHDRVKFVGNRNLIIHFPSGSPFAVDTLGGKANEDTPSPDGQEVVNGPGLFHYHVFLTSPESGRVEVSDTRCPSIGVD